MLFQSNKTFFRQIYYEVLKNFIKLLSIFFLVLNSNSFFVHFIKLCQSFVVEIELVEKSLLKFRQFVEREKRNGRAEIEERALVLRETTRAKERAAKALEACVVNIVGRKQCNIDKVDQGKLNIVVSGIFRSFYYKGNISLF